MKKSNKISATELAVLQHLFAAIPEEMGALLGRSAFSSNIKERRDYSCALFNASGDLLAQAAHIPVHLGAMPRSVEAVLTDFPALKPGDVVMLNDPFRGGSHLPDITLVSPMFLPGCAEPSGYAATRAHHADVGGMSPGSLPHSESIFQEGLRLPPVRIQREGNLDEDLMKIFCANSRSPQERKGDLRAQIQSHCLAEKRWRALGERAGGVEGLTEMGEALRAYGARKMQACLDKLPPGRWEQVDFLEGADRVHARTALRATLKVEAGAVEIDFSASDDTVSGSLNAVKAICESAVYYGFLCLLFAEFPGEVLPVNAGTFSRIHCLTRPGSVLDARLPHAVAGGNVETSQRIVDVVLGLLSQALPGRFPAQSQGTMNNVTMGGLSGEGAFSYYETLGGGAGAGEAVQGADAIQVHMTNTLNTPVEAVEYTFPLMVRTYAIRTQSGGAGRQRGGEGMIREWEMRIPVEVTLLSERRECRPSGAGGGGEGKAGAQYRIKTDGCSEPLKAKGSWTFAPGERLRIETPGGGGYGEVGS
ncbi:hydantoinase B/oxoprolinase family protein [Kiritimatiellaeota bacterium B1221]|nr:hydantoinase B/oxoprolinase family protein [Kiritimatiellaeota bacterium B1221]